MAKEYYLPYFGTITGLTQIDNTIVFVTDHEEGLPTALYFVNVESGETTQRALPQGGLCCLVIGQTVWVAGSDQCLYRAKQGAKTVDKAGQVFDARIQGIAGLDNSRLAVLAGEKVYVVSESGERLQEFVLDGLGTCLTADSSGNWCVVGTQKGNVYVFSAEERDDFSFSEMEKLHEGAVEALLMEPDDLRFYSSGADRKLLSTFARGKLEPEDRGRDGGHDNRVTDMINTGGERFITGSYDKSCKAWVRKNKSRPATLSGLSRVENLGLATVHGRPHLVVNCADNTLRLFILDANGKIGDLTIRIYDAYEKAKRQLDAISGYKADAREKALGDLCAYGDSASINILAAQIDCDSDHDLRLKAAQFLVKTGHRTAIDHLFPLLKNAQANIREVAFQGLQSLNRDEEFKNLDAAIASGKTNVAFLALERYREISSEDRRAHAKLVNSLNASPYEVRAKALSLLESVSAEDNTEADLIALSAKKADIKCLALMQLYQRKLLNDSKVLASLKRKIDDDSADVRRLAFLVSLLVYPKLAKAIRERDKKIHADLFDIESFQLSRVFAEEQQPKEKLPSIRQSKFSLSTEDYTPLLQAMACKQVDIALLAARGLALLSDPRAYGYLLQLSTETEDDVRVSVCESLAALGDTRATSRLKSLCSDSSVRVRDAAFSAVLQLYEGDTLSAVQLGFTSAQSDIRKRSLQILIRYLKKSTLDESALEWELLLERLNDNDASVRSDAFKSILNFQPGGGKDHTLALLLQSAYADVRREVQTELMAEISRPWAKPLLLKLIDDPDKSIREDTLNFLLKRSKGKDISSLEVAIQSHYSDTRFYAIEHLIKNPSPEKQKLLLLGIEDEVTKNRTSVIRAIIVEGNSEALISALTSKHNDVRLESAISLARMGNREAKAVLDEFIGQEEPDKASDKPLWKTNVIRAMEGVALLGDKASEVVLNSLLNSPCEDIQCASAQALFWVAGRDLDVEPLRAHENKEVRQYGFLAGAVSGNTSDIMHVLTSDLPVAIRLGVMLSHLDDFGEHLITLLDSKEGEKYPVLLVILLLAIDPDTMRTKELLSVLGSEQSINKLMAAKLLELSGNHTAQLKVLQECICGLDSKEGWEIPLEEIATLSAILRKGKFSLVVKTLELLDAVLEEDPERWALVWSVHRARYKKEIAALGDVEVSPQTEKTAADYSDLVFGTYTGLLREAVKKNRRYRNEHVAIRQAALNRLRALADSSDTLGPAIDTVVLQALGDATSGVRDLAFKVLEGRIEAVKLAEECLQTSHIDLGVKGLTLLTGDAGKKQARQILGKVMCERQDFLAVEATKMLLKIDNLESVTKIGLASTNQDVRSVCVDLLLKNYAEETSRKALYKALTSPYQELRESVAMGLGNRRDEAAIGTLFELLVDAHKQPGLIKSLLEIGTETVASGLLDQLEQDASNTASAQVIINAVGQLRFVSQADRLAMLAEKETLRSSVFSALLVISGYDQRIINKDEEDVVNLDWMSKQFERHDEILEKVMQMALNYGDIRYLTRMIGNARWSKSPALQNVLETLTKHPDDDLRHSALEAVGWRLRKRKGGTKSLVEALDHKSHDTKFIAAEELAFTGQGDGFSILFSAVELMQDIDIRKRAVAALGKLKDERSLDLLLRLAGDSEHAMQSIAAEAIGYLGSSEKADDILHLLEQFVSGQQYSLVISAIKGLRWFNNRRAWELIRTTAREHNHLGQEEAIIALGFAENDEANRNALLDILRRPRHYYDRLTLQAYESAKRLLAEKSIDAEIGLLQSGCFSLSIDEKRALERVVERSSGAQLLKLIPDADVSIQGVLITSLLEKPDLGLDAVQQALSSIDVNLIRVACEIVGRTILKETAKETRELNELIVRAKTKLLESWNGAFAKTVQTGMGTRENKLVESTLLRLVWVCGRRQIAKEELIEMVKLHPEEPAFEDIRFAAVMALSQFKNIQTILSAHLGNTNASIRRLCASVLSQSQSVEFSLEQLDRSSVRRMEKNTSLENTLKENIENPHYQAYGFPLLIAQKDIETLSRVAQNGSLESSVRLGAIEALSAIATNESDEVLVAIGKSAADEELCKSAWCHLRRSKRIRAAG